ncbi:GNAT family N-acetyltransferase [Streptomyces beihaiensis]|uniref:GNAT family N-acetyltransferase n=1 Tax=Streptomyces beihaiensis TaxID=2984495 RepID=A0ABT3U3F2_9ACTN|nr:GNAT family N-acetyltransferase [Streptomyces beihaiensis]MCX3063845.1 GNAT family N-acetyltransferase [Streptomyces beihaiensis]
MANGTDLGRHLVRAWVEGWVVSRGAAPPLVAPWGYTVRVGLPAHVGRHVLAETGDAVREADVRKAAESTRGAGMQLKVFADPARVLPWLGPEWTPFGADDWLMARELAPADAGAAPATAPPGYELHTWTTAGVTRVLVTDEDGAFAARGQVARAPTGTSVVVDQVETSEDHRRKGLGTLVMRRLHARAAADGARRAVLAATPEGRLLYEAVGWHAVAPLTNARCTGTAGRDHG